MRLPPVESVLAAKAVPGPFPETEEFKESYV